MNSFYNLAKWFLHYLLKMKAWHSKHKQKLQSTSMPFFFALGLQDWWKGVNLEDGFFSTRGILSHWKMLYWYAFKISVFLSVFIIHLL